MTNGQQGPPKLPPGVGDYYDRLDEQYQPHYDVLEPARSYPGKPPVLVPKPTPEVAPELAAFNKMFETSVIPKLCACMCEAIQKLMNDSMLLIKSPMWVEPPIRSAVMNGGIDRFGRNVVIPVAGFGDIFAPYTVPDRHIGVIAFFGNNLSAAAAFATVLWQLRINDIPVPGYGDQASGGFLFQLGDPVFIYQSRLPVPIILPPRATFRVVASDPAATGALATARIGGWVFESNMTSDIISALGGGHGSPGKCGPPAYMGHIVR